MIHDLADDGRTDARSTIGVVPGIAIHEHEVDVADAGDMAGYTATYDWEFTDPETGDVANEQGNWVMVFRRQEDGSLKIYREVISDIPASGEGVS